VRAVYFSHPSGAGHDTGAGHPEGAARIAAIEEALVRRDWLGYERRAAPAAGRKALEAVHTARHLEAVRAMSAAGGGALDADTPVSAGSWEAAVHAAGGACAVASALLERGADVAFSAARPPGHHASANTGMGFCLVNNVAVAARHALDALGASRVAIIDWDVHHGNGTNDIFRTSDAVLYTSIHQGNLYPGTGPLTDIGSGDGRGFSINLPVPAGSGEDTWLSLLEWIVVPVIEEFRPDLILISAGFDAHRDDPLGGCMLDEASFAEMARHVRALGRRAGAPVGAVLEGGYALPALGASVAATMEALADETAPASAPPDFLTSRAAAQIGHHWTL
jgi:acetoin utilization deacetylase AcuC-like enzyme